MPDTVNIIDLDIDQGELIKKLTKLKEEIKDLRDNTKELEAINSALEKGNRKSSDQYKENAKQIEINTAQQKGLSTEYRNNQGTLTALTASEKGQLGTLQQLAISNKALRDEVKTLDLSQKAGKDRLTEINKELDKNNKFIKDNADASKKQTLNIGNYGSALQGLPGPLGRIVTGFQAMTKAAWAFIATPIGIVIAAVAAAIAALTSYFRRSEEGQNAFTKITKVLASVLDNLLDIVDKVGKALFNAITKPQEAWEGFKNVIKGVGEFFKNTFGNIIGGSIEVFVGSMEGGFARIGLAWQKFKGLFVDNADGITEAQLKIDEANKKVSAGSERVKEGVELMGDAYDKVKDKIKDFTDEIKSDAEISKQLADEEASLRIQERKDIVENAKLRGESAKLRAEAEKMKLVDARKSIELYEQAFDADEKIIEAELKIAERKVANAKIAAKLANSDIAALDKIAQLEAEVENKRAAFDEKQRERSRRLNMIKMEAFKQEKDRLNASLEAEKINADEIIRANERILKDDKSTYDQRLDAFQQNTDNRTELLRKQSDLELGELESRHELQLISTEDFQQQKQLIELKYNDEARKLIEDTVQFGIDLEQKRADNAIEIQRINFENENAGLEYQREYKLRILDLEYQAEIRNAEKTGADITAIDKKYAKLKIDIEREVQNQKLGVLADFSGAISELFGKNTVAAKVAAVAQATINTYLAATAALASGSKLSPIYGILSAAAAILTGIASVRKIMQVSPKGGGGGSGGVGISMPSGAGMPSISTNIAAADGGTTTMGITDSAAAAIKQGMKEALAEAPPVLVIEDVTFRQTLQDSVSQVATV